jgi:glycosyltransferase involved in cell wall biosynthesis
VVLPVFCEAERIEGVLDSWRAVLERLDIDHVLCVYDDGSWDGTKEILERLARQHARVDVRRHENRGHGPTILEGYERARGEWVLQIDGDGEIAPEHLGAFWAQREGYDFLVGCREGAVRPTPRRLTSLVSRVVVRFLFGGELRDVNCPYRLMRAAPLKRLLPRVPADAFAPNVILSGLAVREGLRVREVPVPVLETPGRRSSLGGARLWRGAWRSLLETARVARARGAGT